jgi:hypothetical protein
MSDKPPASSYSAVVKLVRGLETELEAYEKNKDRRSLVNASEEQLNRYATAREAAAVLNRALQVLGARLDGMPVNLLLRTITVLSKISNLLAPPDAEPPSTPHHRRSHR